MKTQEEKDALLADLKHHQEIDAFVRGTWLTEEKIQGNGFKGCFYGCTMQTSNNPREKFAEKHDIDLWYVYITERIFEGLPADQFAKFPYESIEILPLNYDFNRIKSPFYKAMLLKQLDWISDEVIRTILIDTAKLFDTPFNLIDKSAARSAASAAASAAWSAWSAESARSERSAWSAAASAAWSERSAWSAESAARSAASAAASAAWSASEQNFYVWMRDILFELISQNQ